MVTAKRCRTASSRCRKLGERVENTKRRATILMAMSRTWNTLANQMDRYEIIKNEENRSRAFRWG
jgi:hypothetical protein